MLVPTTILAQQHYQTFRDRFRDTAVEIEVVSRFRAAADLKGVIARFREGKVDILIGTHRVLSRDIVPAELGLVWWTRSSASASRRRRSCGSCAPRST